MKVFFDCEFTGLHQNTTLISIGLIAETGESFYAEFTDYDPNQVDSWIQTNVIDNLLFGSRDTSYPVGIPKIAWEQCKGQTANIFVNDLKDWLYSFEDYYDSNERIELWGDCLAYDWVLFCEQWGGPFELPECIYYIPFDLATLFRLRGIDPDTNREEFAGIIEGGLKHNALWDARMIKACYEKLMAK